MKSLIGRWRVSTLLFSWFVFWTALIIVKLGPAILAGWRAIRGAGGITASAGDSMLSLTITEHGATTWSGSESIILVIVWTFAPPLLLFLLWIVGAERERLMSDVPELLARGDMEEIRRRTQEEEARITRDKRR